MHVRVPIVTTAALCAMALLAPTSSAATPTSCAKPQPSGDTTVAVSAGGTSRPFLLYVPKGYDGKTPMPLVVNLHGSDGNGSQQMDTSAMRSVADDNGFAVAAPNGAVQTGTATYRWNVPGVPLVDGTPVPPGTPNDEAYLIAVIAATKRTVCVDPRRIYMTGYSGGARMTSQMACDRAGAVTAIAPVAGLRAGVPRRAANGGWQPDPGTCKPSRAVPVATFHGTADTVNPYKGSDDPRWGYDVRSALRTWAALDGCGKATQRAATTTVDVIDYPKCRNGTRVKLYRANGAGHTWPGPQFPGLGGIDRSIDASRLMWRFFAKYTLPAR